MRNSRTKSTMNLGLILGGILIVLHLLGWLINKDGIPMQGLLNYTAIAFCIYRGTKNFRDDELKGSISYGQAVIYGSLTGFFSSVVYALYFYVFVTFMDPEFIDKALLLTEESMYLLGRTEEEIDLLMSFQEATHSPVLWSISAILSFTFSGFVVSLIISFFTKREINQINNTGQNRIN